MVRPSWCDWEMHLNLEEFLSPTKRGRASSRFLSSTMKFVVATYFVITLEVVIQSFRAMNRIIEDNIASKKLPT